MPSRLVRTALNLDNVAACSEATLVIDTGGRLYRLETEDAIRTSWSRPDGDLTSSLTCDNFTKRSRCDEERMIDGQGNLIT